MTSYIIRRVLVNLMVLVLISVVLFGLVHAAPGNPVDFMISPEQVGPGYEAFRQAKIHELGLDKPVPVQYVLWLREAATGDFGYSFADGRPVVAVLAERIPATVELLGLALVVQLVVALPAGMLAAMRRNTMVDYVVSFISLGAISTPGFFLGMIAIYVFSLKLRLLPSSGLATQGDGSPGDLLRHLVMPVLILGLAHAGGLARYVRGCTIAELGSDYVRTARAKGASDLRVMVRHVLRNALIPVITVVMMSVPGVFAGAVVLEQIFAWPGMGQLAVASVQRQDFPVVIGFAGMVAVLVLLSNLVADVLYTVVDPRVRLS